MFGFRGRTRAENLGSVATFFWILAALSGCVFVGNEFTSLGPKSVSLIAVGVGFGSVVFAILFREQKYRSIGRSINRAHDSRDFD